LSTVPERRLVLINLGLAVSLMLLSIGVMVYTVSIGDARADLVGWWVAFTLGGALLSYVLIRSGWSRRLADPSLTMPQIVHAVTCCALGYALVGPMRGAVFPILMITVMYGMFQLRAAQALSVSLYALLLFGATMAVMIRLQPHIYVPTVEIGHYMMLVAMLPAVSLLVGRLSRIRLRLATQKRELAQALDKLQAMAMRDDLTGLFNRRQMQTLLEQEVQRCLRSGSTFCLALLDIDHFKRINDQHGHGVGDEVLRAFAQAGLSVLRASDLMARWGGEEFVVMLPNSHLPLALAAIERLRGQVGKMRVTKEEVSITVSVGLTEHHPKQTLAQTIERADRLLYEAKHQGRNRVVSD
jgi:diguanylate cyclase (GGDEF)-like protein